MCVQFMNSIEKEMATIQCQQEQDLRAMASIILKVPKHELPTNMDTLYRLIREEKKQQESKPNYTWTTIADAIEKRRDYGKRGILFFPIGSGVPPKDKQGRVFADPPPLCMRFPAETT